MVCDLSDTRGKIEAKSLPELGVDPKEWRFGAKSLWVTDTRILSSGDNSRIGIRCCRLKFVKSATNKPFFLTCGPNHF